MHWLGSNIRKPMEDVPGWAPWRVGVYGIWDPKYIWWDMLWHMVASYWMWVVLLVFMTWCDHPPWSTKTWHGKSAGGFGPVHFEPSKPEAYIYFPKLMPLPCCNIYLRLYCLWGMATWADEDYIGKIARTSRKCHSIKVAFSTVKRSLIRYKQEWHKAVPNRHWDPLRALALVTNVDDVVLCGCVCVLLWEFDDLCRFHLNTFFLEVRKRALST